MSMVPSRSVSWRGPTTDWKGRHLVLAVLLSLLLHSGGPQASNGEEPALFARRITSEEELIGGPGATGRVGDYLLGNSRIRVIVGDVDNFSGYAQSGGNLLDAAPVGSAEDELDIIFTYHDWPRQALYQEVSVAENGGDGGRAVVRSVGRHNEIPSLRMTTDYVLLPEVPYLVLETTLENHGPEPIPDDFRLGDVLGTGSCRSFILGHGYIVEEAQSFLMGGVGEKVSYGWTGAEKSESTGEWLPLLNRGKYPDPIVKYCGIAPGETVSYKRIFIVGAGDIDSLLSVVYDLHGTACGAIEGTILGQDESKLVFPGRVTVQDRKGIVFSDALQDETGRFRVMLPPGEWILKGAARGYEDSPAVPVSLDAPGKSVHADLRLAGKTSNPLVWGPYLTRATTTSIVVNWKSETPATAQVWCGLLEQLCQWGEPAQLGCTRQLDDLQHVALVGLLPDQAYVYQVVLSTPGLGTEAHGPYLLRTAPEQGPFSFTVYGDTRTWPQRHRLVCDAMARDAWKPSFALHTGDLVYDARNMAQMDEFFESIRNMSARMTLFPALGNHENNSPIYYDAFVLPEGGGDHNERWYSFDYGKAHFICLDSDVIVWKLEELIEEQNEWLAEDLETHKEAEWKFVYYHHPMYTSDFYEHGAHYCAKEKECWEPLFVKYGVDVVFNGHCHVYERIHAGGVTHVVTGGGGAPLAPLREPRIEGSQAASDEYLHYVRVGIDGKKARFEAVKVARVNDDKDVVPAEGLIDSFELQK